MSDTKEITLYGPRGERLAPSVNGKGTARRIAGRGRPGAGYYRGGIRNPATGLGGGSDKMASAYFVPTIWYNRRIPTTIYTESWAARAAVDIPVEDMLIRWRKHESKEMEDMERKLDFKRRIKAGLIGGRLYGTTILCMMTNEDNLLNPLVPRRIRKGDLLALRAFDRYDLSVPAWYTDPRDRYFLKPKFYDVYPTYGRSFRIHHSRTIRFDGLDSVPTDSTPDPYPQDWSNSVLIPILNSILEDSLLTASIAHLSQEASIAIMHVQGLRDKLAGTEGEFEVSVEEIGEAINRLKSTYRLMMLDEQGESFRREAANFGGLPDLMDKFSARIAAGARIPKTRFLSTSPGGLNATGESDTRNHVATVEAFREAMFDTGQLRRLDEVMARSAGLSKLPEWEWQSMLELSDSEKLELSKKKVETLSGAIDAGMITGDEGREALSGDDFFGELSGEAPGVPGVTAPFAPGVKESDPAAKPPEPKPEPKPGEPGNPPEKKPEEEPEKKEPEEEEPEKPAGK